MIEVNINTLNPESCLTNKMVTLLTNNSLIFDDIQVTFSPKIKEDLQSSLAFGVMDLGQGQQFVELGDLNIGTVVRMPENEGNNRPVDFIIVQQGNPDNTQYTSGGEGTWLISKYLIDGRNFTADKNYGHLSCYSTSNNSHSCGYAVNSDDHEYIIKDSLKDYLQNTAIPFWDGYSDKDGVTYVRIFIPSLTELGEVVGWGGAPLEYFQKAASYRPSRMRRSARYLADNENYAWITRSEYRWDKYASAGAASIDTSGMLIDRDVIFDDEFIIGYHDYYTYGYKIRPIIVLPYETKVDNNFNIHLLD